MTLAVAGILEAGVKGEARMCGTRDDQITLTLQLRLKEQGAEMISKGKQPMAALEDVCPKL